MAYQVISQNNTTTTLADENGNVIRVPARVSLATSTDYTIKKVNNSTATLEDGNGNIIRDVPCVAVLVGGEGGGGDSHNLGYYETPEALRTAHPTATAGDFAIVNSTDTVWLWDTDNEEWVDSDQKGQVTSVNGQTGDVVLDLLPSQTGNAGKFLTTDGTDASWAAISALQNTATGTDDLTILGTPTNALRAVNIGNSSVASGSASSAYGYNARATSGSAVAIGDGSQASGSGSVAILGTASATSTIAIKGSATATYAVQIGGNYTNNEVGTFKFANGNGNWTIISNDGTIPTARLTKVNSTITLAAADWSSNTQTVSVTGMTATGVVMVSPDPTDQSAYTSAGVLCTAQAAGTLTFTCDTVPSGDLSVNIVML